MKQRAEQKGHALYLAPEETGESVVRYESMKVFIRDTKNGWYFQAPSRWTPDQSLACDLKQVARAVEEIFQAHLEDVEILLSYDEPRYDLVLPVPPSPSRGQPLKERRRGEPNQPGTDNRHPPRKKGPM